MKLKSRGWVASAGMAAALSLMAPQVADAAETIALFDHNVPETPESVVVDAQGNRYVSLALTGEIRRIAADGTQSTYARLPIGEPMTFCSGFFALTGALAMDPSGTLYVSVGSCIPENRGVWRVKRDGTVDQLAQLPFESFPNGIAYHHGRLYVADSNLGLIWTVDADGGPAMVWKQDPILLRSPGAGLPGANGIQYFRGEFYVAVTDTAKIVAIEVDEKGHAGNVRVHATGVMCDDLALDVQGNVYCASPFAGVLRINAQDGSVETLLGSQDLLDWPTSISFGRRGGEILDAYITNAAFPGYSTFARPSLMRLEVGIPGAKRW